MGINEEFDKWWDDNEKQFMADACHMSEFHMAHVVWQAAVDCKIESLAAELLRRWTERHDELCENGDTCISVGGADRCFHPKPAILELP